VPDWRQVPDSRGYYHLLERSVSGRVPNTCAIVPMTQTSIHGRTPQARGVFRGSITKRLITQASTYGYFQTSEEYEVQAIDDVRLGDVCWSLYGAKTPFILRQKGQSHEVVSRVLDLRLQAVDSEDCQNCQQDYCTWFDGHHMCPLGARWRDGSHECHRRKRQGRRHPGRRSCCPRNAISTLAEVDWPLMETIEIC
jgi:hypothetical protein